MSEVGVLERRYVSVETPGGSRRCFVEQQARTGGREIPLVCLRTAA